MFTLRYGLLALISIIPQKFNTYNFRHSLPFTMKIVIEEDIQWRAGGRA